MPGRADQNPQTPTPAPESERSPSPPDAKPDHEGFKNRSGEGCGWTLLLSLLLSIGLVGGGIWGVRAAIQRGWIQPLERSFHDVSLLAGPHVRPSEPDLEIQLYYVVDGRALAFQTRKLRAPAAGVERIHVITREISQPVQPDLYRSPLPDDSTIRGVYVHDTIVWLDLSEEFLNVDEVSPLRERLIVYALVNSFLLNDPDLRGVRILIEGRPIETAWGWLDLSSPLGRNLSLII